MSLINNMDKENRFNEKEILKICNNTEYLKALGVTPNDIIRAVKMAQEDFCELQTKVRMANSNNQNMSDLLNELKGYNVEYNVDNNIELFDLNYNSLTLTIRADYKGIPYVSPYGIYVYPDKISSLKTDNEMFVLDFDKDIDFKFIEDILHKEETEIDNNKYEVEVNNGCKLLFSFDNGLKIEHEDENGNIVNDNIFKTHFVNDGDLVTFSNVLNYLEVNNLKLDNLFDAIDVYRENLEKQDEAEEEI